MLKADKVTFVNDLTGQLKEAKGLLLVNYSGLGVKAQQELKARLGQSGAKMVVVKNTLLKRAGEAAGIDKGLLDESVLQGQTALVIAGEDPVAPIQVIGSFAKEFETPKFKVGVIDGAFQDSEALGKISSLPGRDALLSQLLGTLMSSEYGLVGTLQGNLQKLVYILKTKAG
jgi:large subunit ribosomal protein L10